MVARRFNAVLINAVLGNSMLGNAVRFNVALLSSQIRFTPRCAHH